MIGWVFQPDISTNNWFNASRNRSPVKLDHGKQIGQIRHCHCRHGQVLSGFYQLFNPDKSVCQRKFGMDAKMNKWICHKPDLT